jgi:hypothetical protein
MIKSEKRFFNFLIFIDFVKNNFKKNSRPQRPQRFVHLHLLRIVKVCAVNQIHHSVYAVIDVQPRVMVVVQATAEQERQMVARVVREIREHGDEHPQQNGRSMRLHEKQPADDGQEIEEEVDATEIECDKSACRCELVVLLVMPVKQPMMTHAVDVVGEDFLAGRAHEQIAHENGKSWSVDAQ